MHHAVDASRLGPAGESMTRAIEACVHCGFCLPACPTYHVLGQEMDSPRGRIFLMKEVLEGALPLGEAQPFVDRCLGCFACVTACPSGVEYGDLVIGFREYAHERNGHPRGARLLRALFLRTLSHPDRFRLALRLGSAARLVSGLVPDRLRALLELLPRSVDRLPPLPDQYPAHGRRRARVALLAGCVQQVLAPGIGWATLRVLARNGVEVVVPRRQSCCGALAMHAGDARAARELARRNLAAFPADIDAIVTNAAGCGSGMKEYGMLFKGRAEQDEGRRFAGRVRDIAEFLDELGLESPPPLPQPLALAYQDACHLAHAQRVRAAPRRLLGAIPNVTLVEIADDGACCGSAGTYNLDHPAIAQELGRRKAAAIVHTGAQAVASGNIGCLTQMRAHLAAAGSAIPVHHTIEVLDRAYHPTIPLGGGRL
jgi:glycolate oxidase iron-sulfur subunit